MSSRLAARAAARSWSDDVLLKLVGVGGGTESGCTPGLFTEQFGLPRLELLATCGGPGDRRADFGFVGGLGSPGI
jgi:hypothetical protein